MNSPSSEGIIAVLGVGAVVVGGDPWLLACADSRSRIARWEPDRWSEPCADRSDGHGDGDGELVVANGHCPGCCLSRRSPYSGLVVLRVKQRRAAAR